MSKILVDREEIEAVRNTLANGGGAVGVLRWAESVLAAQPAEAEGVEVIGYMEGDYRRDQPSIYIPHVRIVKSCAKGEALMTVAQHERIVSALARPAQTEQQPVKLQHMAYSEDGVLRWVTGRKIDNCELYAMPDFGRAPKLYAAPIAQAAPQPEQSGLPWPVIELLSRYKRDLERRTFPDTSREPSASDGLRRK